MNKKSEKQLFVTDQYAMFKKLAGNRPVEEKRVKSILDSIKNVGYFTSPILVNEKYEVIDGQGRLEAFKRIGLPVEYFIEKGGNLETCIEMNIHQSKWTISDYIESNIELKKSDYIVLKNCMTQYSFIPLGTIGSILNDSIVYSGSREIKNGIFRVKNVTYLKIMEQMKLFKDVQKPKAIATSAWWLAIYGIVRLNLCEIKSLIASLNDYGGTQKPSGADRLAAMHYFEDVYNYSKRKRVYFYQKYIEKTEEAKRIK